MSNANQCWNGNVGEWSEPYVVYKLLADGRLCQADEDFSPSPNDFINIISVIRDDVTSELNSAGYVTFKSTTVAGGVENKIVPVKDIAAKAAKLFNDLISRKEVKGAFPIPWLEKELKSYGFRVHKNPVPDSQKSVKRDITLKVQDPKSGGSPVLGFSIKSEVGAPPTLFKLGG